MPRTIVPEEQQRVNDLTTLANSIRPTENRTVHVDSDSDGAGNIFRWDPTGDATTADGVKTVASTIAKYAAGGAEEGIWRRMQLPFAGATTADLSEAGSESDAPAASDRLYFTDSRAISAVENNTDTLQISNGISMNSSSLSDLPTPSGATDAVTKEYVDGVAQGIEVKDSVDVTDTSGIDLTSSSDPNPIDGYTLQDGDRILLQSQGDATENGIYVASTAADPTTWTRAEDFNESDNVVSGSFTFVEKGNNNAGISYIVSTNDPIDLGNDLITFTQFSSSGEILAGDGLNKSGNTFSTVVSDFAGTFLSDNGSNDLQVNTSTGIVDNGSGSLQIDIGVSDGGSDLATTNPVTGINFGSSLNVTDDTGSGDTRVTVDVDTAASTSLEVTEGGSTVNSNTNSINLSSNLNAVNDGNGQVTISAPNNEIQDAVFNGVLAGTQTLINVTYDDANNEVDYVVDDDLSKYDNSTSAFIKGIDVDDGTTDIEDPVDNLVFGDNLNVTNATGGDGTATVASVDTQLSVSEGGAVVKSVTESMNFTDGITVLDDGTNAVTIQSDARFGNQTFSGDGIKTQFQIPHGLSSAPRSWSIESTTDDGSGHSHSTADDTNITVFYDTAPPSGTNNIVLNYVLSV